MVRILFGVIYFVYYFYYLIYDQFKKGVKIVVLQWLSERN